MGGSGCTVGLMEGTMTGVVVIVVGVAAEGAAV
jgi:hypothetical protein